LKKGLAARALTAQHDLDLVLVEGGEAGDGEDGLKAGAEGGHLRRYARPQRRPNHSVQVGAQVGCGDGGLWAEGWGGGVCGCVGGVCGGGMLPFSGEG
jgi:hypothetical protein